MWTTLRRIRGRGRLDLHLLLDKIATRKDELLEKQRDIELTLLELEEVETGARTRIRELDAPVTSEDA